MKVKYLILMTCLSVLSCFKAQDNPVFQKVHKAILEAHPELAQKEIFVSAQLPAEAELADWKKTQNTFLNAKLKGGRGFQVVLVYDAELPSQEVMMKKKTAENGFKYIGLDQNTFQKIKSFKNFVLDNNGNLMVQAIEPGKLFDNILKHITR